MRGLRAPILLLRSTVVQWLLLKKLKTHIRMINRAIRKYSVTFINNYDFIREPVIDRALIRNFRDALNTSEENFR